MLGAAMDTMTAEAADLAADHALMTDAVRAAGAIARDLFGGDVDSWDKRPGHPVSAADLAVDKVLEERLRDERPGYGWLSEESPDDGSRRTAERTWMVDPIDGTRAFLKGRPEFSVTVALIEGGRPVLGAVYNPMTEEFYDAIAGGGTRFNGRPATVADRVEIDGAHILVSRSEMQKKGWDRGFADCRVEAISSIALKLARVAAGLADATITLWPKNDWDLAAGDLLIAEAGGAAMRPDGSEFTYNDDPPRHPGLIAAPAGLIPALRQRLARL
jgi:myo-inositol-1(or 4)-monophosphatase